MANCLKIQFLAIYPHLHLLMGDPLTSPPLSLTKMLSLDAVAILNMERRLFQVVSTPLPAICCRLPENSLFGQLPPFAPAYRRPLDPASTFIDKNFITGCCCNDLYGKKENPGSFYPIVPPSPAICLISIFGHFPPFVPTYR